MTASPFTSYLKMFGVHFSVLGWLCLTIVRPLAPNWRFQLTSLTSVCSPNEDFGRSNKRWNADFRSTFQWFVTQIEYSRPWKVLRESAFHLLLLLPKSSFGRGVNFGNPLVGRSMVNIHIVVMSSSCEFDRSTSTGTSAGYCEYCEFDQSIGILSSCSCEFDWHVTDVTVTSVTSPCGTAGVHVL